jgi:hypothetical protein
MWKKYVSILLLVLIALSFAWIADAAPPVSVYVNGIPVKSDVQPYIERGRTMVALRFVAEALGARVDWDATTYSVYITEEKQSQPVLKLNGELTTWPYWYEEDKLFLEYRDTLSLLKEYNSLTMVYYDKAGHEIYINNRHHTIYYKEKEDYTVLSLNQLRDFGEIKFNFDPASGNLTLIH